MKLFEKLTKRAHFSLVEITIFHEVAPIKNFLKFKIWNSASAKILARHIFAAFLKFSETNKN